MSHPNRPPKYRHHKARNCAVVTINGRNHYLGPFGSPESHEKYACLIAEQFSDSRPKNHQKADSIESSNLTVNERRFSRA